MKCQCSFCEKFLSVDDEFSGENVICPNCHNLITIKITWQMRAGRAVKMFMTEKKFKYWRAIIFLIIFVCIFSGIIGIYYQHLQAIKIENNFKLGIHFFNKTQYSAAITYFTAAAEKGHADAQYHLGLCYYNMLDYDNVEKWWRKAAAQGHQEAQYNLKKLGDTL